jgi:hypothetical protein
LRLPNASSFPKKPSGGKEGARRGNKQGKTEGCVEGG